MFNDFKFFVRSRLTNHEARITNLEERKMLRVFSDVETGIVYDARFGVSKPLMRQVRDGGGHSIMIAMGRSYIGIGTMVSRDNVKPVLEQCGEIMFHRDRAPKCDYVMQAGDGSIKYFTKAIVPADAAGHCFRKNYQD